MFSPKFYGNNPVLSNPCGCGSPTPRFDFYINCNQDQYAIQEIKNSLGRIVELKIFLWNGSTFQEVQHFTATQFGGVYFSNVKTQDQDLDGDMDLVAEVFGDNCQFLGTAVLVNDCPYNNLSNPCDAPCQHRQPCHDPWHTPCPPPRKPCGCNDPCPSTRISKSDIAMCKLVEVDICNAPVTSVNEICIKPIPPITSHDKLCQLMQCCKKTAQCLENFDPCYTKKIRCKGRTRYSGPVIAKDGVVDVNACTITFSGIKIDCSDMCHCGKGINCIKF